MEQIKAFITKLNEKGVPVPLIRKDGKACLATTLVIVSSCFVAYTIVKGVNAQDSLYWAFGTYGLYFGRKLSGDGKSITIEAPKDQK